MPGAEQDDAAAQHILGLAYEKGQGVEKDYVAAYAWLNLAGRTVAACSSAVSFGLSIISTTW